MLINLDENKLTKYLIGIAFEIFNKIGPGYPERIYQKAFQVKLNEDKVSYSKEKYCNIDFGGHSIGNFRLDFLVDNRIIVELKVRNQLYKKDIAQVLTYLKHNKLKVGIIFLFTTTKIVIKRVLF